MPKHPASQYFNFSLKERIGIITLIILILLFILLPFIYSFFLKQKITADNQFKKEIASLKTRQTDTNKRFNQNNFDENNYQNYYQPSENYYTRNKIKATSFYFDPNTASPEDWKKLGIREKTIGTIKNFLAKGGHFYKPEDIGKIWGLQEDDVKRLMPYVQIAGKEKNTFTYPEKNEEIKTFEKKYNAPLSIDVNNADSTAFISLPGIGSKLSQRIINFRDKLGGFYKVEQVAETFGLADSTFQKIKASLQIINATVKQFNINTATIEELKTHPYIRYNIATAIIQYRNQHGNFSSVNDLKKIMLVTEDLFNKISPYLKTN